MLGLTLWHYPRGIDDNRVSRESRTRRVVEYGCPVTRAPSELSLSKHLDPLAWLERLYYLYHQLFARGRRIVD